MKKKEAVETKVTFRWENFLDRILSQNQTEPMSCRLWVRWKQEAIISCGRLESGKSLAKNTTLFGIFRSFKSRREEKTLYDW